MTQPERPQPEGDGPPGVSWRYSARQWAWSAIDLVFPPGCGGCGKEGQRFCDVCLSAVEYLAPPLCQRCGYPLPAAGSGLCPACRRSLAAGAALDGIRSAAYFSGPLQHALHRLKYRRDIILADSLAHLLRQARRLFDVPGQMAVPVPLSRARLGERGYNQAGLLARGLADLDGLAYAPRALARARHTVSQVGLSAVERQSNVAGAFSAAGRLVNGKAVILVDDVCTTGATLAACAQALRQAGAVSVWGLTVARAR